MHNSAILKGGGIFVDTTRAVIVNNTICCNSSGGIFLTHGSWGDITNNIICQNTSGEGIGAEAGAAFAVSYNNVWNNSPHNYTDDLISDSDISQNPLFINEEHDNYFPAPSSPCQHAGHPDPSYYNPYYSRNTMGAYGGPLWHYKYFTDVDNDGYSVIEGVSSSVS